MILYTGLSKGKRQDMNSSSPGKESPIGFFFAPESVAVVGASRTPGKIGNTILNNLINLKYRGGIFPINPNASDISGLKTYPSIADVPHKIEVAVIAVPAHLVLDVVRDCAMIGVRGIIIISSGFSEAGEEGIERQRELIRIASSNGMRIIGPNTTGILNTDNGFTSTFVRIKEISVGSIAFIAQTGMFAGMMMEYILTSEKFGLSKVAGLGNKSDVADHEILDYLAEDTATQAIMMYIEGIKDGRLFFEAARRLTRKKPMIVLKVGKTEAGAKAARSHTGSLTGRDEIFEALCRQVGIIRVNDFDDLVDSAKMFAYQPLPRGNRIAIITLSGGAGVMSADACLQNGLRLADIAQHNLDKIIEKMPSWATLRNPVDVEPLSETVGRIDAFRIPLETILPDDNVDMCLIIMGTTPIQKSDLDYLKDIRQAYPQKPIAVCIIGSQDVYEQLFSIIEEMGIPVYPSVHRVVNSLATLYRYSQHRG